MEKLKSLLVAAVLGIAATVSAQTADDRPLFDVMGNVKTITAKGEFATLSNIIEGCRSVTFSKTGSIIKINGRTPASFGLKVTSRANGMPSKTRLTYEDEAGEMPYTVTWRYNSKRKPIKTSSSDYPIGTFTYTFDYDAAGRMTKATAGGDIDGRTLSYNYTAFDAKGNWTKRTVTIRYYAINASGKKVFSDFTETETEARTITYY